jgi:hypothetical protein
MKADAKTPADREKEALQWAVDHFRNCAADMKPEGSARHAMEDALRGLIWLYDSPIPEKRAAAEEDIKASVKYAWLGNAEDSQYMRELAAMLMERGDQLPEALHNFIVEFLRNPNKPKLPFGNTDERFRAWLDEIRSLIARKPGPSSGVLVSRNIEIWAAMEHIVKTWNIPATRNQATKEKGKRASAASIVREAIEKGADVHLSEAAVVKAWKKMRLPGEQALALEPSVMDVFVDQRRKR